MRLRNGTGELAGGSSHPSGRRAGPRRAAPGASKQKKRTSSPDGRRRAGRRSVSKRSCPPSMGSTIGSLRTQFAPTALQRQLARAKGQAVKLTACQRNVDTALPAEPGARRVQLLKPKRCWGSVIPTSRRTTSKSVSAPSRTCTPASCTALSWMSYTPAREQDGTDTRHAAAPGRAGSIAGREAHAAWRRLPEVAVPCRSARPCCRAMR